MLQGKKDKGGLFFKHLVQAILCQTGQDRIIFQNDRSGRAGQLFDQAHLSEELVLVEFCEQKLILCAIVGVDPHGTISDIIHAVSCVALTENHLAFFEPQILSHLTMALSGLLDFLIPLHCFKSIPASQEMIVDIQEFADPGEQAFLSARCLASGRAHFADRFADFCVIVGQVAQTVAEILKDQFDL